MSRILVAVTTYNEIDNLPSLVDEVFLHAPQVDLLVVDDNSPDGTGQWCRARAVAEPRLRLLAREGKLGQGSAVIAGMNYAIDEGYDFTISMDADFSHHPRYLPELIAALTGGAAESNAPDVVIGSRYVAGGGVEGWPLRRRLMSRGVNWYARLLLRLPTRDCSGGFRGYRVPRLAELDLGTLVSRGYSFHEEILWRLKRLGCRIVEVPITFVDRVKGESKINGREALNALRLIAWWGMRERFAR